MENLTYYQILGVDKTATQQDIKDAYRKLARKHHPDLNPTDKDANQKFQKINEANEILSDPTKRKKYDQQFTEVRHKNNRYEEWASNASDFEAEVSSRFRNAKYRGKDYYADLNVNLVDVFKTQTQTLTVNGKTIRITIPAGVENNQTIKVVGYGGDGWNGGPAGDLYLTFKIIPHATIKRLGNDLFTKIDLKLCTAMLGGDIIVDTLHGKVRLQVTPETQNGSKIKLKGRGFPVYKNEGKFGDFYITYNVILPTNLTDKQKDLFTELSKTVN